MKNIAKRGNIFEFHKKFLDSALIMCYNDDTSALKGSKKTISNIDYIKNFQ